MTVRSPTRQLRFSGWHAPVAVAIVLVALAVVTVVVASQAGGSSAPSVAASFAPPQPARPSRALDVELAEGGRLRVNGGSGASELVVPATTKVDALQPVTASDAKAGDRVVVIGIGNEVRNASIHLIVLMDGGALEEKAPPTGAAGFSGHEASRDGRDLPLWWGTVESVSGQTLAIRSGGGVVATLEIGPGAPLRRLRAVDASAIASSDRVALHVGADGSPDLGAGVLVLVGGAR